VALTVAAAVAIEAITSGKASSQGSAALACLPMSGSKDAELLSRVEECIQHLQYNPFASASI